MFKITLIPSQKELYLPHGSKLTELNYELSEEQVVSFGCQAGSCGACIIHIIDGHGNLGNETTKERDFLTKLGYSGTEFRLACQCRLNGDVMIQAP